MEDILDRETPTKNEGSWLGVLLLNSFFIIVCVFAYELQTQIKDSFFFLLGEILLLIIINSIITLITFIVYDSFVWKKWFIMSIIYLVILLGLIVNAYIIVNYFL